MNSATVSTRTMTGGIVNYNVRYGRLVANGTAPVGSRPTRWNVALGKKLYVGTSYPMVRELFRLKGRAFAAALKAIETGRI